MAFTMLQGCKKDGAARLSYSFAADSAIAAELEVRIRRKMAYLFPILRDEIHIQYIFQYLESQDPIVANPQREVPAGEQNFVF